MVGNKYQEQTNQYEWLNRYQTSYLISPCELVSRSVPTNETVREVETRSGENSQDCELQSQSAGGELHTDIELCLDCIFTCSCGVICVNLVTIIMFRRYL